MWGRLLLVEEFQYRKQSKCRRGKDKTKLLLWAPPALVGRALEARALTGRALMGRALMGRALMGLPGPLWARPSWAGPLWAGPSWAPWSIFFFDPGLLVQSN